MKETAWEMFRRLSGEDSKAFELGFQKRFNMRFCPDLHFTAATLLMQYNEQEAIEIMTEIGRG